MEELLTKDTVKKISFFIKSLKKRFNWLIDIWIKKDIKPMLGVILMEQKVINIICQAIAPDGDVLITVDTLLSDLTFDSIKFIKIVVAIEREFDFEFDDEHLLFAQFPTVKSIIEYVNLKANTR